MCNYKCRKSSSLSYINQFDFFIFRVRTPSSRNFLRFMVWFDSTYGSDLRLLGPSGPNVVSEPQTPKSWNFLRFHKFINLLDSSYDSGQNEVVFMKIGTRVLDVWFHTSFASKFQFWLTSLSWFRTCTNINAVLKKIIDVWFRNSWLKMFKNTLLTFSS